MSTSLTPQTHQPRPPAHRTRRVFGQWAGLLALAIIVGLLAGAVWGVFRPAYVGEVRDGLFVVDELGSPASVEFASLATFVLITAFLGMILAVVAHRTIARAGGVGLLLWVAAVALACAFSFFTAGNVVAGLFSSVPDPAAAQEAAGAKVVPPMSPGIGWVVAPFVAAVTYWTAAFAWNPHSAPDAVGGSA